MHGCGSRGRIGVGACLVAAAATLAGGGVYPVVLVAARPASVVLLMPHQSGTPSALDVERGIRAALNREYDGSVEVRTEYLDLLDPLITPHLDQLVVLLSNKYRNVPIDVVIAHRTEALTFAMEHRDVFHQPPVVFVEVSRLEATRLTNGHADVTGALVEYDLKEMLGESLALVPQARRVAIFAGASEFDQRLARNFRTALMALPRPYEVVPVTGISFEDQLGELATLPRDAVVMVPSYRADAKGRSRIADDLIRQIASTAPVPTFGFAETWLGRGIVGGSVSQFDLLGEHAGRLVARILNGATAGSIPFEAEPVFRRQFDARALARWGISESRLPAGSEVLFRPHSWWADHKGTILGGLAIVAGQGALIGLLLVEQRRRRRAQQASLQAEQRYRTVADSTADWVYLTMPDGSFRYVSPSAARVTGHDPQAFVDRPSLFDHLMFEDDRPKWAAHRERAWQTAEPSSIEIRIRNQAGETRWLDVRERTVTGADGASPGLRGSARDITDRKRAEADLRSAFGEIERLRDRLEIDNTYLREQVARQPAIEGILGGSEVMGYVTAKVRQVAPTASTVLLLGETGVGKSQLARALHELSPRRPLPFVTLNCAALPPSLVESELFGHERGAFTGAHTRRIGRFEAANGGTLFLDEVGELPLDLQGKLLRTVQDGEFERVGSNVPIRSDVRLIAATNIDLEAQVRDGRFRQDLWYRLNVFPITVPPLRQRPDDIPALVAHFVAKHCRILERQPLEVSRATMKWLQGRLWLGNVRELEGWIERSVIQSPGSRLEIEEETSASRPEAAAVPKGSPNGTPLSLEEAERRHILATLERVSWRIEGPGGAAEVLLLNASTLRSRMKKLNVSRPRPRTAPNQ
jgi:PAS domain S-box-containing protein